MLKLTKNESHLWLVNAKIYSRLNKLFILKNTLSKDEQEKSGKYINYMSKRNYILGKFLTRIILTKYDQSKRPSQWRFRFTKYNKPIIKESNLKFNISHSGDYIAILISHFQCGVDIEDRITAKEYKANIHRFLHPYEYRAIRDNNYYNLLFLRVWTKKEAYVKALGLGMHKDFTSFSTISKEGNDEIIDNIKVRGVYFSTTNEKYICSGFILDPNFKDEKIVRVFKL